MINIILQTSGGGTGMFVMMGLMMVVFYFFMIRPQQKKQKTQKAWRENLKRGQNIVTIGGVHGKIIDLRETTIVIEVDRGTKLTIDRTAVSMDSSNGVATTSNELEAKTV